MFFFLSFCLVHDNWASIKNLSAGYGKINLYVAVEQMKRITIPGVPFLSSSGNGTVRRGTRRHGDTYCRPFEEKGDG